MGKEKKKKPNLKVKTARYFTKTCSKCGAEYPNWFTNCPKCGTSWDDEISQPAESTVQIPSQKKNIKIVVKITEEDFEDPLDKVQLIFSADHGKSWYQMKMDTKMDYFIAEIADVPIGSVIIYYIEVYLATGEKIIENNNSKYFYYKVGTTITDVQEEHPPEEASKEIQDNIAEITPSPQEYTQAVADENEDDITIFGKPQTQVDPDLKICPHCNSKIKKMWSVCPICGSKID
ncbi:MAG: hypothetical protein ACTSR8_13495 [Promethearchaeota archaeon]